MFTPATQRWFARALGQPTPVQARAWPRIAAGGHVLLSAPTGSGKTLAAFLAGIDRLLTLPADAPPGVRVLYVSPLKALVVDVEKNLRAPLRGIAEEDPAARPVRVDVRTGDTPARERARFQRRPAEILVTTPESLYLILGSAARERLRTVETVIVDEIHALADGKRGAHLALSLERLDRLVGRDVQRVGLSATVRPLRAVAEWLGGDREVEVVDAGLAPRLDLQVEPWERAAEVEDATAYGPAMTAGPRLKGADRLLDLVRAHRTTLLFVNSRRLCERLAKRLNDAAGEEVCRAHHGSIAPDRRALIEGDLKAGRLRAIVATGTLELGIDMAAVDLVVLVESPGSVARGLQRAGRAGHQVGALSKARLFPRHRADLLECAALARDMLAGDIEPIAIPRNCLDVLAQQLVAIVADGPAEVEALYALVRRAAPYRGLGRAAFDSTLDLLAGRWTGGVLAHLPARVVWDRVAGTVSPRPGAAAVARLNAGTIADRGMYAVYAGPGGPRVGELEEELVFETAKGDVLQIGASSWRVLEIDRERVIVAPAPGEPARMPFWRGAGAGRPAATGRRLGAFLRELEDLPPDEAASLLVERHALHPDAAVQVLEVLAEQRAWNGCLPTDRAITVEATVDELGDTRVSILSPFGARVHGAWSLAIEAAVARRGGAPTQSSYGDDGITLRLAAGEGTLPRDLLLPDPEEIEDLLLERLVDSALFRGCFRENAARALVLPRNKPGRRTPLWAQRVRASHLLAAVRGWPEFPLLVETVREVLQDVLDVPGLVELLRGVRAGAVRVDEVNPRGPSPLARALAWRWTSEWIYQLDGPAAERRANALTVDRELLREVLGEPDWVGLLDPAVVAEVAAELQGLGAEWRPVGADGAHDTLRRLGDLDEAELALRVDGVPDGRALRVRVAGAERWIALEDAATYRDALAVEVGALPPGLDAPVPDAFAALVLRWARSHVFFDAQEVARRFGVPPGVVEGVLRSWAAEGALQQGRFRAQGPCWVATEVLRRVRRRAVEAARQEAAAVSPARYAGFLRRWHGLDRPRSGLEGLRAALEPLEGLPLSFAELEGSLLPARVAGYRPALLDELGARGEIGWVGRRALGEADAEVVLARRDRLALLAAPGEVPGDAVSQRILGLLRARGASFLAELGGDADTLEALWGLAWAGLLTNDTFHPLRARGVPRAGRRLLVAGGRWGLVEAPPDPALDTHRALAVAEALLARWGVVGARVVGAEGVTFAWPGLRALEDAGRARRGWYVDGAGGAQLGLPGAVDALRAEAEPAAWCLAATDPAQPYGLALDWPVEGPRRIPGARVALVEGRLVASWSGRSLLFHDADPEQRRRALEAWAAACRASRQTPPRIERIDGEPAVRHPAAALLRALGARVDMRGIELVVPP